MSEPLPFWIPLALRLRYLGVRWFACYGVTSAYAMEITIPLEMMAPPANDD